MKIKLFCSFALVFYSINIWGADVKPSTVVIQDNVNTGSKENQSEQKKLFKKRDLISLLSLLGFSGINFGFFYKLFNGANNKKTQIAKLQTQQQTMQVTLDSHEKMLNEVLSLQKDLKVLQEEKESLEKRSVDMEQTVDKSLQEMKSLQELENKINTEIDQKLSELETKLGNLMDEKIGASDKENQKAQSSLEKKIQKLNERTNELSKTTQVLDKGILEAEKKVNLDFEQKRREIEEKLTTLVEQRNKETESGTKSVQNSLDQKIEKLQEKYQLFVDYKKEIEKVVQDQKDQTKILKELKEKFDNFNSDIKKIVEDTVRRG